MSGVLGAAKALLEALAADTNEKSDDVRGLVNELKNKVIEEESTLPPADDSEIKVALAETRDLLGKGWHKEAADYLEGVVNGDGSLGRPMKPLPYVAAFEQAFKTACRKHNIIAAFCMVETEPVENDEKKKKYRLITGGMHLADAILSYHLKPLIGGLGQEVSPKKEFLKIEAVEQRNPIHLR